MNATPTILAILSVAASLAGQDLRSGPEAGMQLTPVKVYAPTGPYEGREFDAAAELGKAPGALLFVKDLTRETAPIIRALDEQTAAFRLLGFRSFTVMLTGDRTAAEARTKTVSNALNMINPLTVSLDGAEGPGNYALNRDATLTLVVVKDGMVARSIPFTDTGIKDAPRVRAAIEAVAGKLPASRAEQQALLPNDPERLKWIITGLWQEIAALRQQLARQRQANQRNRGRDQRPMQRRAAQREQDMQRREREAAEVRKKKPLPGSIPEDEEMQTLMRRLIRVQTAAEIDALFRDVDKVVGDSAERRQQMVGGFTRILGATTYGTAAARKRAQDYCDKHGKQAKTGRRD